MKKVVIAGSVSLQEKIVFWKKFWEDEGYYVTDYPKKIKDENFLEEYPNVHKNFFKSIGDLFHSFKIFFHRKRMLVFVAPMGGKCILDKVYF